MNALSPADLACLAQLSVIVLAQQRIEERSHGDRALASAVALLLQEQLLPPPRDLAQTMALLQGLRVKGRLGRTAQQLLLDAAGSQMSHHWGPRWPLSVVALHISNTLSALWLQWSGL